MDLPDGTSPDPVLATELSRLSARIIDILAWIGPLLVCLAVILLSPDPARVSWVFLVAFVFVGLGVVPAQLYLLVTRGQSLGKLLVGVRIVDAWGNHPGWVRVLLVREGARWVIGVIPTLGMFASLVDALLIFRRDRRTGHDQIAGSYVVDVSQAGVAPGRTRLSEVRGATPTAGLPTGVVLGVGVLVGVAALGMSAAIAIPNYVAMQLKAKRAEVPGNVDGIATAEKLYHSASGRWLAVGSREEALGEHPGADQRTWTGGPGWTTLQWWPDGKVRGVYWVEVDGEQAVVHGVCDVDADGSYAEYAAKLPGRAELLTDNDEY